MAVSPTTFTVRQFCAIPAEQTLPFNGGNPQPTGTFIVTGSASQLLINDTRTNLTADTIYSTNDGWFPGPNTSYDGGGGEPAIGEYGIIVGGNSNNSNPVSDGRSGGSAVSCYGWVTQTTQGANETEFIALASYIIGTVQADLATAKASLQDAGYYYQFPKTMSGQSPNTGAGSDT